MATALKELLAPTLDPHKVWRKRVNPINDEVGKGYPALRIFVGVCGILADPSAEIGGLAASTLVAGALSKQTGLKGSVSTQLKSLAGATEDHTAAQAKVTGYLDGILKTVYMFGARRVAAKQVGKEFAPLYTIPPVKMVEEKFSEYWLRASKQDAQIRAGADLLRQIEDELSDVVDFEDLEDTAINGLLQEMVDNLKGKEEDTED